MDLTKAKITLIDKDAADPAKGLTEEIDVQFNPAEYTISKGVQIAEIAIPGLDSPILQFVRGQNEKLTLDLFFDTTLDQDKKAAAMDTTAVDVRTKTRAIYELTKVQAKTHAPPRVTFSWGSLSFNALVESVQQKFTLFNPKGIPLRATLSVTFREYKTLKDQLKNPARGSADHTKRRIVQRGDTLSGIAAEEYTDPGAWRRIAEVNDIVNPRQLAPGTVLAIPPLG